MFFPHIRICGVKADSGRAPQFERGGINDYDNNDNHSSQIALRSFKTFSVLGVGVVVEDVMKAVAIPSTSSSSSVSNESPSLPEAARSRPYHWLLLLILLVLLLLLVLLWVLLFGDKGNRASFDEEEEEEEEVLARQPTERARNSSDMNPSSRFRTGAGVR